MRSGLDLKVSAGSSVTLYLSLQRWISDNLCPDPNDLALAGHNFTFFCSSTVPVLGGQPWLSRP